ncbi:MAG: hypothetical protein LUC95_03860 [Lachnospiraceae bacterium]|nr:hypothetical protein [Lachnospiraceae bacterium]
MPDKEKAEDRIEELLLQYTYYYGMRRSRKDRQRAYAFISDKYTEMGYPVTFDRMSLGMTRIGYCIAGNIKSAEKVFIAPFNTQNKTHFGRYRFFPFREKDSRIYNGLANAVDSIIWIVLVLLAYGIVYFLSDLRWAGLLAAVIVYAIYWMTLKGIFNFSPSAPLALMHYMALHGRKKKVAYVFLDRCVDDYLPLKAFLAKYKEDLEYNNAQVIFLNNMAHGEQLVFASKEPDQKTDELAQACGGTCIKLEEGNLPRCFDDASNLVFVTGADQDQKGRYYVKDIRSKKDRTMDVVRLKKTAAALMPA